MAHQLGIDLAQGEVGAILLLIDRNDEDKRRVLVVKKACIDDLLVLRHLVLRYHLKLLARHGVRLSKSTPLPGQALLFAVRHVDHWGMYAFSVQVFVINHLNRHSCLRWVLF